MFERPHHRRVAKVLDALDGALLETHRCFFGGDTAIVLRHSEYRQSIDVDFLVSDIVGYRELRRLVTGGTGISAIARHALHALREVRTDQYGIRTLIEIDGESIRFEIIHEGRIVLDTPLSDERVCDIATLSALDMVTTKLLANADRWADRAVYSRDVIDLAMMEPPKDLLDKAIAKAAVPYGDSARESLDKAIGYLRDNPHRLDECQDALDMRAIPKAVLWQRIKRLIS